MNNIKNINSNDESIDLKIKKFLDLKKNINKLVIKPTPFKVSTHSAKAKLTISINIEILSKILYKNLTVFNKDSINLPYFSIKNNDLNINLLKKKKKKEVKFCIL